MSQKHGRTRTKHEVFSDVYNFKIALGQDQNCLKIYYLKKSIFLSNKCKILNNLYWKKLRNFNSNILIVREKHILKTCSQGNTEL